MLIDFSFPKVKSAFYKIHLNNKDYYYSTKFKSFQM